MNPKLWAPPVLLFLHITLLYINLKQHLSLYAAGQQIKLVTILPEPGSSLDLRFSNYAETQVCQKPHNSFTIVSQLSNLCVKLCQLFSVCKVSLFLTV